MKQKLMSIKDYAIGMRRYLHQYPEVSSKEEKTSLFLQEEVRKLGLTIETVETHGFIATLDTGRIGPVIGLRTELDALPILEHPNNLLGKRNVISLHEGVAHLCGHDGHMAILMSTMKLLVEMKDQLVGQIIFIFEEGEETQTGIDNMIEALRKYNLDVVYGNHLASFIKTGKVSFKEGPVMAGASIIDFKLFGKSGHAARPDLSINPLVALNQIQNGLNAIWTSVLDPTKTLTLAITSIHGGTAFNVIPEEVHVMGTSRYFDEAEGLKAMTLLSQEIEDTATKFGCKADLSKMRIQSLPVLFNDSELSRIMKSICSDYQVVNENWFASESFACYSQLCPSLFAFIGTENELVGSGAEHHNQHFDLDEESLLIGVDVMMRFVLEMQE